MKPFKEAEGYGEDLQSAYDYYKAYGADTAGRFLKAYEKAVATIQYSPFICRPRRHGWRQMIIRDYPSFSIFYREFPRFWLLAGVVSTVQDPDSIQARLLIREVAEEEG
jgi:ParE toxin of type II toxin-antitoxin system, parDE